MRDILVDEDLAFKVVLNNAGKFSAAFDAAESATTPSSSSDKLEAKVQRGL